MKTTAPPPGNLAVLTSGGDAQGMNAAVRAVVRAGLDRGLRVYAVYEGYQGMVDGGSRIREMDWESVGGILHRGGTLIGSARCQAFRERPGRLRAAKHLAERGIDRLVIIGGDGSLTGAHLFREEWPALLAELVRLGEITEATRQAHPHLSIVGLVGSIDNDMVGTDMTIGADTALHRITEALDAIASTAASHQRSFIVEVMGRDCGYLALMGALAGAADWVFIPERPPEEDDWAEAMCAALKAGRDSGRRDSIIVLAEGARDKHGQAITSDAVKRALAERLGHDARITILGHVQRGGAPSAFDRWMSTLLGHAAVETLVDAAPGDAPLLIGIRGNRISRTPLMQCVNDTRDIARVIDAGRFDEAQALRGGSFKAALDTFHTLSQALPHSPRRGQRTLRLAVMNAGAPAPGMNTATRVAVRLGLDQGHTLLGVRDGFRGLAAGRMETLQWMTVSGWASMGGCELGTNRHIPTTEEEFADIARHLESQRIDGLLVIGGWHGYEAAYALQARRERFPAFDIPVVCLPASINNNLPGSELAIGADTALNSIVEAVDKIKQSAVATHRVFVVEVMGGDCGYLTLMSGLATGAERLYLPEEGVSLKDLQADVEHLRAGFHRGKRLGLLIRNERVNATYDTHFMTAAFQQEGQGLFEARQAVLGHIQQGGDPTPFDRIQATLLATRGIQRLIQQVLGADTAGTLMGLTGGRIGETPLAQFPSLREAEFMRPKSQWWLGLRPVARVLAQPGPRPHPSAGGPAA